MAATKPFNIPFAYVAEPVRFVFQPGLLISALSASISDGGYKTFNIPFANVAEPVRFVFQPGSLISALYASIRDDSYTVDASTPLGSGVANIATPMTANTNPSTAGDNLP